MLKSSGVSSGCTFDGSVVVVDVFLVVVDGSIKLTVVISFNSPYVTVLVFFFVGSLVSTISMLVSMHLRCRSYRVVFKYPIYRMQLCTIELLVTLACFDDLRTSDEY